MYQALLVSPDGKDYVTDFANSKTIDDVWEAVDNMGSRWFFYPIPFVITSSSSKVRNKRIVDIPNNYFDVIKNTTVKNAMQFIEDNPEQVDIILS